MKTKSLREMLDALKVLAAHDVLVIRTSTRRVPPEAPMMPPSFKRRWWPMPQELWEKLGFEAVYEELPGGHVEMAIRLHPQQDVPRAFDKVFHGPLVVRRDQSRAARRVAVRRWRIRQELRRERALKGKIA